MDFSRKTLWKCIMSEANAVETATPIKEEKMSHCYNFLRQ